MLNQLLKSHLELSCECIHENRLEAFLDTAEALQNSQCLSLTAMCRKLKGNIEIKHKIKKVDRLVGNKYLHQELEILYEGLSEFVFTYLSRSVDVPLVVDLCFIKDDGAIQMLSAEVSAKGRTLPIGFSEDWFKEIEAFGWHFVCRIRKGKSIKLSEADEWITLADFIPQVKEKTTVYDGAFLMKSYQRTCRIVTTKRAYQGRKVKLSRGKSTAKCASGSYRNAAKEPGILATNLPLNYKGVHVVKFYEKRMQIEESFRDVKSTQFGLGGRNVRTHCVHRWGVKMLLAAIVQITYWIIGIIGHSQGMQKIFQSNTVKDRKVFSYFTLGKFIIEYDKFHKIQMDDRKIFDIIQYELARNW